MGSLGLNKMRGCFLTALGTSPSLMEAGSVYYQAMASLAESKANYDIISTNRQMTELDDVIDKLYTCGLFGSD